MGPPGKLCPSLNARSRRAAQQATTCSNRAPAWLDGVVRGAEEEGLNHQVVSFNSPAGTLAMPGMLRKSTPFVPRYQKFESISLQRRVYKLSVPGHVGQPTTGVIVYGDKISGGAGPARVVPGRWLSRQRGDDFTTGTIDPRYGGRPETAAPVAFDFHRRDWQRGFQRPPKPDIWARRLRCPHA